MFLHYTDENFPNLPSIFFSFADTYVKLMMTKRSSVTLKKCICDKDEMTVNKASDTELQQDRIKQKV